MVQGIAPQHSSTANSLRRVAPPIFPENVGPKTVLKLQARDSNYKLFVEVQKEVAPGVYTVLCFDNAKDGELVSQSQYVTRDASIPNFFFLRADIATPEEVAAHVVNRRAEIDQSLAKLEALQSRFEEKIGYHCPVPK